MRIAFFIPNMYGGGAEKTTLILMNELVKYYEVYLILVSKTGIYIKEIDSNIKVIELKTSSVYKSFFSLYSHLNYIKPKVIISSLDTANILSTLYYANSHKKKI